MLLLLTFSCAHHVTGSVHDNLGNPIEGAQVKINAIAEKSITGPSGTFQAPSKSYSGAKLKKEQSILITYVGYEPVVLTIDFSKGKTHLDPIVLKPIQIKVPYRQKNLDIIGK